MTFIVKKNIKGREYYYLNENKRIDGKVKTKTLAYLGKNRKDAEKKAREIIEKINKNKMLIENSLGVGGEKFENTKISIEELAAFCKRKGFVYPSSEIYHGFSGFWDLGPLGTELFNNIKQSWWKFFVQQRKNMVGLDSSIISNPKTWETSGHLENFSDVSVRCKKCKKYNKVDKSELAHAKCGFCNGELEKETAKDLNLMFKVQVGPIEEDSTVSYLRPETAQGMFLNFKNVANTSRMKLPFGIAQIGKCFRNEIAPRDFLFRSREFTIAEFEFFTNPGEEKCEILEKKHLDLKIRILDAEAQFEGKKDLRKVAIGKILEEKKLGEWHAYWLAEQILWLKNLGLDLNRIKIREHMKDELSHYSSATFDIDYEYSFGSREIAGNANRGVFDLSQHQEESGEKLEIFDEKIQKSVIPKVIEPTFGMERIFLAILSQAYFYDEKRQNVVLKLNPKLSPIKAAIFPIVKKPEFEKIAKEVYDSLKEEWNVSYDESGSIGKRYSRNDEIGTPFCITIDGDSKKRHDVTIRERDSGEQIRVKTNDLKKILGKLIGGEDFFRFGKKINTRKK
ncbi:glycine--tRNA ligase [Candidatus Pacearchaeota archaeon]|nr:glycine--tRNA ligase [Candidatus Pacearchaeota archaeon]